MNPRDNIRKLLQIDSLQEAENITGEDYHDSKETSRLGLLIHMQLNKAKENALLATDDTTFCTPLPRYLRIIESIGFKKIHSENVGDPEQPKNELMIFWHDDGILLVFDTYSNGESVNGGNFYYNWKPTDWKKSYETTSSGGFIENYIWVGSHDCREALRLHISDLNDKGEFLKTWVERPFLWLIHYMDTKDEGYDYKKLNEDRISKFPKEVQEAIGLAKI